MRHPLFFIVLWQKSSTHRIPPPVSTPSPPSLYAHLTFLHLPPLLFFWLSSTLSTVFIFIPPSISSFFCPFLYLAAYPVGFFPLLYNPLFPLSCPPSFPFLPCFTILPFLLLSPLSLSPYFPPFLPASQPIAAPPLLFIHHVCRRRDKDT